MWVGVQVDRFLPVCGRGSCMTVETDSEYVKRGDGVVGFFPYEEYGSAVRYFVGRFTVYRSRETGEYVVSYEMKEDEVYVFDDDVDGMFGGDDGGRLVHPDGKLLRSVGAVAAEYEDDARVDWSGLVGDDVPSTYGRVR